MEVPGDKIEEMVVPQDKIKEMIDPDEKEEEVMMEREVPKYLQEYQVPSHHKELIDSLTTETCMGQDINHKYKGFLMPTIYMVSTLSCYDRFQARDTDIFLASYPKTGTTWLKALAYAVLKRAQFPDMNNHPLLTANPHQLVHYLEHAYLGNDSPDLERDENQRLLATHLPFSLLPNSVLEKDCKIVYVSRNPKDTFLSYWKFCFYLFPNEMAKASLEEEASNFAKGVSPHGPYWDHVLGYWEQKRVLFLRFEEMKEDTMGVVRKLAEFFECPITSAEKEDGVVEKIVKLCSFEHLSNLDVNRNGKSPIGVSNMAFFRRGAVGDSANFLSPESVSLIDHAAEDKFCGSGLDI